VPGGNGSQNNGIPVPVSPIPIDLAAVPVSPIYPSTHLNLNLTKY
jgi:hypothetical protein